ncbi:MAG TPA: DUF29 domain-containing protein [Candidatus Binataceae bacterium]|nr:DUF29 domain-containing protein [Candidatus Binataceae bacterium]
MQFTTEQVDSLREGAAIIDADYYAWLVAQAHTLRRSRPEFLDWENLAEELEGTARHEERALESYLVVLLSHLLKYRYQASKVSGSWEASIENSRERVARLLHRSPSLKSKLEEIIAEAYPLARREAGAEMGLRKRDWERRLPKSCEWTLETILDANFWPIPEPEPTVLKKP